MGITTYEDLRALARARERGSITLDELMHLASGSPVDVDEAIELATTAGLKVVETDGDGWADLEELANDGPDALRLKREAAAPGESTEPATLYLRDISKTPLLEAHEEVDLAKRKDAGDVARRRLAEIDPESPEAAELRLEVRRGDVAFQRLMESNLRLVVSVARKYMGRGLSFLDLVQEGNIGLHRAVEKFDWRRGFRFSTYAYWWIRQAVTRAIAEQTRMIRLPIPMIHALTRMYNTARELEAELQRPPTPLEIADRLGLSAEQVEDAFKAARMPISLDTPVGEEGQTVLAELIADATGKSPAEQGEDAAFGEAVSAALGQYLTERGAEALRLRFGFDRDGVERTLAETGQLMGISRERVRQIEADAIQKLKRTAPFKERFAER